MFNDYTKFFLDIIKILSEERKQIHVVKICMVHGMRKGRFSFPECNREWSAASLQQISRLKHLSDSHERVLFKFLQILFRSSKDLAGTKHLRLIHTKQLLMLHATSYHIFGLVLS